MSRVRRMGRVALVSLLFLGAGGIVFEYKFFLSAYWVRDLGDSDPQVRERAVERLQSLGEPGYAAIEDWLAAADASQYEHVFYEVARVLIKGAKSSRFGRARTASLLIGNIPRELTLGGRRKFSLCSGELAQLGEEAVDAICQELEGLQVREGAIDARVLASLMMALVRLHPAGKERAGPVLDEFGQSLPGLSIDGTSWVNEDGRPYGKSDLIQAAGLPILLYSGRRIQETPEVLKDFDQVGNKR